MGEGLKRARRAARATQEVLAPVPRGYLRDWNFKLGTMPTEGRFEVLRIYSKVFRHVRDEAWVIEPTHGQMFVPVAWRPIKAAR